MSRGLSRVGHTVQAEENLINKWIFAHQCHWTNRVQFVHVQGKTYILSGFSF